jgi:hypothetical protein
MRFKNIPATAFFFWGNSPMPYMNYLSIETFKKHNPGIKVVLCSSNDKEYVPPTWSEKEQQIRYRGKDYTKMAKEKADASFTFNLPYLGLPSGMHAAHQADMMRHWLMKNCGGIWSDMDIFHMRSIDEIPVSEDVDYALSYFENKGHYNTVFVMSAPESPIAHQIQEASLKRYRKDKYECCGVNLIKYLFNTIDDMRAVYPDHEIGNIPEWCFNPYYHNQMGNLYNKENISLLGRSLGIHWFGGHPLSMRYRARVSPEDLGVFKRIVDGKHFDT